ncbi:MAG: RluA family pseudouridine synthase [Clostridia bacterium]|nr:RluA family pseudouridine synthase [Clostridia bacterium]
MSRLEYRVSPEEAGKRLDQFLAERGELTRSRAQTLIRDGQVTVDGETVLKPSQTVTADVLALVDVPEPKPVGIAPQDIAIELLYEDDDIAVVNKPAGMVVHPAAGNEDGTLVNALLFRLSGLSGIGGEMRPGIVHRLDKDTSGVLVIAKNDRAHQGLSEQFKDRSMEKHYRTIVSGQMKEEQGLIDAPIGRHKLDRKKMAVTDDGRPSQTEWKLLAPLKGASLLDVHLLTGRTHQIRVHMLSVGHPVLGDRIYAPKLKMPVTVPRLMLHAYSLELTHPVSGERLRFEAPLPEAFGILAQKLSL